MDFFAAQPNSTQTDSLPNSIEEFHGWNLEEAQASFSEVVRLAKERQPQRITIRGEDAVVVLSATTFARMLPLIRQPNIHALLSNSPLSRLDFNQLSTKASVRDVEL